MTKTPIIDLQPFCAQASPNADHLDGKPWRAAILSPWTRGGRTWATDACIVLSVPIRKGYPDCQSAPDAAKLFFDNPTPDDADYQPLILPEDARETTRCGNCLRSDGWQCPICHGTTQVPNMERYPLGRRTFALWMLCRIATLPQVEVAPFHGDDHAPMRFRFANDGKGLCMALKLD